MEIEKYISGYCRMLDASRIVEVILEDGEITDSHEEMARIARIACKNAKKVIFLMDSSKKGNKYTYTVCRVPEHDNIIVL